MTGFYELTTLKSRPERRRFSVVEAVSSPYPVMEITSS